MSPQREVQVTVHYEQADGVVVDTAAHSDVSPEGRVGRYVMVDLPVDAPAPQRGQKVKLMWVTKIEEAPEPTPNPAIPERHLCIRCRNEPCNGPDGDFQRMLGPRCLRLEREEQLANRPRSR